MRSLKRATLSKWVQRGIALVACATGSLVGQPTASAATVSRAVTNVTQLYQLFTDAEANPQNTYEGTLTKQTYKLTRTLTLKTGHVALKGGGSVNAAATYVLECTAGCTYDPAKDLWGGVLRLERRAGAASPTLKAHGITLTGGQGRRGGLRGGGGAMVEEGALYLEDSVVRDNQSGEWGSGILVGPKGTVILRRSVVRNNRNWQLDSCGGGMTAFGGGVGVLNGKFYAYQSSIVDNKSCRGGGISFMGGTDTATGEIVLQNSTLSGNEAQFAGGALWTTGRVSRLQIEFSTIVNNVAGVRQHQSETNYGGGIGFWSVSTAQPSPQVSSIRINGTVLANNRMVSSSFSPVRGEDCYIYAPKQPFKADVTSNYIRTNGNCTDLLNRNIAPSNANLIGTEAMPLADPQLDSLDNSISGLPYHRVKINSPLRSAYDRRLRKNHTLNDSCPAFDQIDRDRATSPQSGIVCDIGSNESTAGF